MNGSEGITKYLTYVFSRLLLISRNVLEVCNIIQNGVLGSM